MAKRYVDLGTMVHLLDDGKAQGGSYFPKNHRRHEYEEYLEWIAEGNTPELPPPPPPEPEPEVDVFTEFAAALRSASTLAEIKRLLLGEGERFRVLVTRK